MSPFKQSFLGTLAAVCVVGAVLVAGVVAAQEYYPVRDVNADGRIDLSFMHICSTIANMHEGVNHDRILHQPQP